MTFAAVVAGFNPIGHWRLGESSAATVVDDSSPNGFDGVYGTTTAKPTLGVTGLLTSDADTAASFDGGDDATITRVAAFDVPVNYSLFAVIQTTMSGSTGCIMSRDPSSGNRVYQWQVTSTGKLSFVLIAGANPTVTSTASVNDGNPHDILLVHDAAGLKLYIDGALDGSASTVQAANGSTSPITIGRQRAGAANPFTGTIDECAMFGAALTAGDAAALHDARLGVFSVVVTAAPLMPGAPRFLTPIPPIEVFAAPLMPHRAGLLVPTVDVPLRRPLGRFVVDPSQGWGTDLGTLIAVRAQGPDGAPGSRVTQVSEEYDDPTIVDGRPVS